MKKWNMKKTAVLASAALAAGSLSPVYAAEESKAANIVLDAEIGDSDFLSALLGTDISWLESIVLDIDADVSDESLIAGRISPQLNGTKISDIMAYVSAEEQSAYIQIPELSEGILKIDLAEAMAQSGAAGLSVGAAGAAGVSAGVYAEATPEVQQKLEAYAQQAMATYLTPFMGIAAPASASKEITVEGQKESISYSGYSLDLEAGIEVLAADLEALKTDATLLEIMESSGQAIPAEEWEDLLDEGISALIDISEDGSLAGTSLNFMFGSNADGSVMNGYVEVDMGSMQMQIADVTAQVGEDGLNGNLHAGVEGSEANISFYMDGETYGGALSVNGESMAAIEIETGDTTSITLTSEMEGMEGFGLVLSFGEEEAGIALTAEGYNVVSLTAAVGEGSPVETPDSAAFANAYDVEDDDAMNAYLETLDQEVLMEELEAAGLGEFLGMSE